MKADKVTDNVIEFEKPEPKFKLLPGFKDEDPNNWLGGIPEGHMFFTCQRGLTPSMFCQVTQHFEKTSVLFDVLNKVPFCVVTRRFSANHEKLEVIATIPKQEEQDDGSSVQV